MSWDIVIFRWINGLVGQTDWLDILGWFSARQLIFVIVFLVLLQVWAAGWQAQATAAAGFWRRLRLVISTPWRNPSDQGLLAAARAAMTVVLSWSFNQLFYLLWFRARPFVELTGVNQLVDMPAAQKSFPSDHATLAFAVVGAVILTRPAFGLALVPLAVLVSVSRIFVGVHFPSDVLAGAALGLVWALAVSRFLTGRRLTDWSVGWSSWRAARRHR